MQKDQFFHMGILAERIESSNLLSTRMNKNINDRVIECRNVRKFKNISSDQIVEMSGICTAMNSYMLLSYLKFLSAYRWMIGSLMNVIMLLFSQ